MSAIPAKRRCFRFSLRGIFVVVALVALGLGWGMLTQA
jgi:hypothetical protein